MTSSMWSPSPWRASAVMAQSKPAAFLVFTAAVAFSEVKLDKSDVVLLKNTIWIPNSIRRTPDKRIIHCCGQRSCRGHSWVNHWSFSRRNAVWLSKFGLKPPDSTVMHFRGHRSHRSHPGSVGVNLPRSVPWSPNIVTRTAVSVFVYIHC